LRQSPAHVLIARRGIAINSATRIGQVEIILREDGGLNEQFQSDGPAVSGRLSFTASLITQGRHKFYSLAMPSDALANCSFVARRNESRDIGFQRYLDKRRAQEIADYVDSGLGTIPTAVIVSAQEECRLDYNSKNRTVSFDSIENAFLIIDGQHRVYGFSLAASNLRVPVIIYNGLDRSEEAQLFIDVNTKQKPVPSELLLDIKKLAKTQGGQEKKMGIIFDLFDSEPGSALLGRLSAFEKKSGLISRVTFNVALKPIADLFLEARAEDVYDTLNPYYMGVKLAFEKLSEEIDLFSPMTFRAMTALFPEVREKVEYKYSGEFSARTYSRYLTEILSDRKISALKGRQKSMSSIIAVISDAMKPRKIF
jgi:DGQHR domain-containing protein